MHSIAHRGWFRRNWLWAVPLGLLAIVGIGAAVVLGMVEKKKASPPYRMAMEQLAQDPQVVGRLGEPLRDTTWLPTGSVFSEGQRGDAILGFDVAGPKGKGHVSVQARQISGQWSLTRLDLACGDGTRIAVATAAAPGSEAPRFGADAPPFTQQPVAPAAPGDAPAWTPPATGASGSGPELKIDLPTPPAMPEMK